jgi:hypothetical protein
MKTAEIPKNSDPVMILDFSAAKFAALCRRANRIGAVILTGRAPNPAMGAFKGQYTLADACTSDPLRVINLADRVSNWTHFSGPHGRPEVISAVLTIGRSLPVYPD